MKHILSLALLICVQSQVFSQDFQWLNTKPIDFYYNSLILKTALIIDNEDIIVYCGLDSAKTSHGFGDIFIQKTSLEGNIVDEIVIQGKTQPPEKFNVDNNNNLYFIIEYEDEDLTWGTDTIEAYSSTNHALVKLNENLDIVWVKYFEDQLGFDVGEYFIIKNEYIYMHLEEGFEVSSIVKMDLDGNQLLKITNEGISLLSTIDIDNDGNIYATGSCATSEVLFNGTSFPTQFTYNAWIVKYNQDGEAQWVKYITDETCINSLVKVSDSDHIYFSGVLNVEANFDSIEVNGPEWANDFFLARLNSDGEFIWVKEVPEMPEGVTGDACVAVTNNDNASHFMEVDDENNIYLTGFSRGTIDWGNGVVSQPTNTIINNDILLWSYDELGNIRFAETAGGEGLEYGKNIVIDSNGEIYLSGIVDYESATFGEIAYEGEGEFFFLTRYSYGISGINVNKPIDDVHIYPNPTTDYINFDITENVNISIFDISGKLVIEQYLMEGQNKKLFVGNLKSGIYIYHISDDSSLNTGKLIKK